VLNGRVEPVCASPQGSISLYYYGGAYYYSFGYTGVSYAYESGYSYDWGVEQGNVFVLGSDECLHPEYQYITDETSYVEQVTADVTGIDVVYFCWRLRTSEDMPVPRTLTVTTVEVKSGGLSAYGDGALGLVLSKDFGSGFVQTDAGRHLILSGTASNDGTYRVAGVPWSTKDVGPSSMGRVEASPDASDWIGAGDPDPAPPPLKLYKNGQVCILDAAAITPEVKTGAVITLIGYRWVAKGYVDSDLRTELRETRPGRSYQRNYMAMHVSKLSGVHTLKFELSIEGVN
jgi:hypothetical protein